MKTAMTIRPLDLTDIALAESLLALQLASYRVEAELIGAEDIPPLHDNLSSLQGCDEIFYGCFHASGESSPHGELSGAISYRLTGEAIDIHRMMVHPNHFRKGIARKLLHHIECLHHGISTMMVSTGALNTPAVKLYESQGYIQTDTFPVREGLYISTFIKSIAPYK